MQLVEIVVKSTNQTLYLMDNKLFIREGMPYEAPAVNVFAISGEGVLCASYGEANQAGKELQESNVWDF